MLVVDKLFMDDSLFFYLPYVITYTSFGLELYLKRDSVAGVKLFGILEFCETFKAIFFKRTSPVTFCLLNRTIMICKLFVFTFRMGAEAFNLKK